MNAATDKINDILASDGFEYAEAANGDEWIVYRWNSQAVRLDAATAAEAVRPADLENGTGWLFGDGVDWVNVVDVEDEDGPADLTGDGRRRYRFA